MVILDGIKIVLLICMCAYAAYTDIKSGIIKNRLILYSICSAFIIDLIEYIIIDRNSAITFVINAGLSIVISFILYFAHIWAGGDTKLLCVISLLIPVNCYWEIGSYPFPNIIVIAIMFILGFIYVIADTVIKLIKKQNRYDVKTYGKNVFSNIIRYLRTIVYIAVINYIYYYFIIAHFQIPNTIYLFICIVVSVVVNSQELFKSKVLVIGCLLFDIYMFAMTGIITINTHLWTYVLVLVFMALRIFMDQFNHMMIDTDDVKKGMILSIYSSMQMQNSKVKGLPSISDETLASRLSEEEVASIKKWRNSKNGKEKIVIVRKIPFAIFMLLSVVIYITIGVLLK